MFDAVIVGAGLAGLSCAVRMEAAGATVRLVEAEDAPGGRIRTDLVEGFRLDRGFQVLLTGYPAAQDFFDLKALRLKHFSNGALVWHQGSYHHFADPFRGSLGAALRLGFDGIVPLKDKLLIAKLRGRVKKGTVADLFTRDESTTRDYLRAFGFSTRMIERFFEPFFGGIFLERELVTSSRLFEFLFRMFAFSDAAVPENGMEMLPRQLAVQLKADTLQLNTRANGLRRERDSFAISLENGSTLNARTVVLAVPEIQARQIIANDLKTAKPQGSKESNSGSRSRQKRQAQRQEQDVQWNRTTTFYYSSHRTPIADPILILNGEGSKAGPVNNAVVMSQVNPNYAPPGAHLIAASVVGQAPEAQSTMEKLESEVRQHLTLWFGLDVARWEVIAGYPIAHALPLCRTALWEQTAVRMTEGVYVCGDYREQPSIQGALSSGRRAAEAALRHVR
jgi:phytoene dehydrogenase-like protein